MIEHGDTNGWPEYKKTVVQQLAFLTDEVKLLRGESKENRDLIADIDKNLKDLVTRDKLECEVKNILDKRENDLVNASKKRDDYQIASSIRINEVIESLTAHCKEAENWKLEVSNTLAAAKARDEASRKSWTIVTVAISLAINAAALILAFIIHASRNVTP